jgi:cyclohexadienyl dehydratase
MYRRAFLLAALLAAAPLASVEAQEASRLDRILERGTLRVGTTGDFPPMAFSDPATGSYAGYDVEVVERLARDLGVEIEYVPTDWASLVDGIVNDAYDITTSASMNVARAKAAAFSDPIVAFGTVPITLGRNLDRFSGWGSINQEGVTVAVTPGTVFDEQARAFFPAATIHAVEPPARDFQEVLDGRALVAITTNVEAASLISTYPELALVPVEGPRGIRPGAFLLPRDDQVWINFVNSWVRMNHASGYFAQLQRRWKLVH